MNRTRRDVFRTAGALTLYLGRTPPIGAKAADVPGVPIQTGPFSPAEGAFKSYSCPDWFRDAKFGIWAHWGPSSAIGDGDWYARNMYIQGTPQYKYHLATYGHPSKFGYKDTLPLWKAERFDPAALIRLYAAAGARYFVSM